MTFSFLLFRLAFFSLLASREMCFFSFFSLRGLNTKSRMPFLVLQKYVSCIKRYMKYEKDDYLVTREVFKKYKNNEYLVTWGVFERSSPPSDSPCWLAVY